MSHSRRASRKPTWSSRLHLAARAVALMLGMVAAGGLISVVTCENIIQPMVTICRMQMDNARLRARNARKAGETRELKERIAWLNTPRGAVEAGRRLGMVRPGEESVRIIVPPPAAPTTTPAEPETAPVPTGELILAAVMFILAFLTGLMIFLRHRRRARETAGFLTTRSELDRRRRRYAH